MAKTATKDPNVLHVRVSDEMRAEIEAFRARKEAESGLPAGLADACRLLLKQALEAARGGKRKVA